jgi:hypothetical protein
MPNNETILSCNTAKLHLPTLNEQARKAHVFEDLHNNLISVGQLCDAGYNINFNKHKAAVHENTNVVITAKRDHSNGLWRAPIMDHMLKHNNVQPMAHCIHAQTSTNYIKCYLQWYETKNKSFTVCCQNVQDYTNIKDVISYLQGTTFSPMKTTIVQAIKNGKFASWSGLTVKNVNKHCKRTIATAKGHLAQTRWNTRLTQPKATPDEEIDAAVTKYFAPTDILPQRSNEVYAIMTELNEKLYTDLLVYWPDFPQPRSLDHHKLRIT